jgi:hypothetical protein
MRVENMLRKNKGTVAVVTLAIVVLLPIAYYAIRDAFAQNAEQFLENPEPKYTECVRDTLYMRYHHMDLLKEIREQVVREGVLSDVTLADCRKCHADRARFCNQCHNSVNLHLDCFGCHNYPETPQKPVLARSYKSHVNAIANLSKPGH